jgi:hypothetical protein
MQGSVSARGVTVIADRTRDERAGVAAHAAYLMGLSTDRRSEQSLGRGTIWSTAAVRAIHSVRGAMLLLVGSIWLCTGPVKAQVVAQGTSGEQSPARTEVVLGVVGPRAEALRGSLLALLRAELAELSLTLVERPPSRELSTWAGEAARSESTLLAILLDARSDQGWRVVVIDAARARAIVRDLPGGIRQDAASIEAVVSIALSAASALRDGLEVASSPLEAVVGGSPPRQESRPPTAASDVVQSATRPRAAERSFLRGSVGASSASFSPQALTTNGLALSLGVNWRARLEARLFGTLFWPATIRSALGEFQVNRALLGAAAGPAFQLGTLSLVPEAGLIAERLRRATTIPAEGILASEAKPLHRVGVVLALRLRLPLFRPLSAELAAGAAYFGRRVQFSSTGLAASPLAEVWPVAAIAQLGLDVATQ